MAVMNLEHVPSAYMRCLAPPSRHLRRRPPEKLTAQCVTCGGQPRGVEPKRGRPPADSPMCAGRFATAVPVI